MTVVVNAVSSLCMHCGWHLQAQAAVHHLAARSNTTWAWLVQMERSQRRLKTTYKVGTAPSAPDLEGVAETQDLARLLIGAFYQSRNDRKREMKGGKLADFPAQGESLAD